MNISQIDSDTDFLAGTTSASYPPADKRRNHNIEYHNVARIIWESDGTWAYDDSNNTTAPVAYRTVANASASYTVPTTAIRVEGVEIKDAGGNWQVLRPLITEDLTVSPEEYLTGTGLPLYYQLKGNEIRLFPAPGTGSVTMSSGMAVRLSRAVTEIAVTATTTEPGFAAPFHRLLSLAAALDVITDPNSRAFRITQKNILEKGLRSFYSRRGQQVQPKIRPGGRKYPNKYT